MQRWNRMVEVETAGGRSHRTAHGRGVGLFQSWTMAIKVDRPSEKT